ncbi:hypothetical protein F7725_028278 [Dissostichus mawsoni]|uniref:Uncharacterized protein n=1 Tax=Dissostichus mawsoni TaxID=36200 RepID=A0A7J5XFI5_DISMA|nr:hypothetical protein F7725_028278 [Dissostichus mawsoni]
MMGRELQLPLDRLRAPAAVTPTAAPCQSARVAEAQRRMKQRFDKRRRVRAPPFTAGDWVRIHRPNRDHKLLSFWTAPMKVTAQLGSATFRLADGSRWHASRLRKVAPPPIVDPGPREDGDFAFPDEQLQGPAGFPPEPVEPVVRPEAHPARVRYQVQRRSPWRSVSSQGQTWLVLLSALVLLFLVPYAVYCLMTAFTNPPPSITFKVAAVSFGLLTEILIIKCVSSFLSSRYRQAAQSSFTVRARGSDQDRRRGGRWEGSEASAGSGQPSSAASPSQVDERKVDMLKSGCLSLY